MSNPADLPRRTRHWILGGLVLLMFCTRFQPIEHFLELPDASWAVFFIAGFYLARDWRWVFPLLMVEAALIDFVATQHLGVSSYCLTPAYWALVPTHAAMWLGGALLRRHARPNGRGLLWLGACAVLASTLAFFISNGSFYWWGGRTADPHLAQYLQRFVQYVGWFVLVPCGWIAIAAGVHVAVARAFATDHASTGH